MSQKHCYVPKEKNWELIEIGQKIKTLVTKKNLEYQFFNLFILAMIYLPQIFEFLEENSLGKFQ